MNFLEPIFQILHVSNPWAQLAIVAAVMILFLLGGKWWGRHQEQRQFESQENMGTVSVQANLYEPDPLNGGKRTVIFAQVAEIPLARLTKDPHLARLVIDAAKATKGEVNFILLEPKAHERLIRAMPGPVGERLQLGEGPYVAALVFERFADEGQVLQLKVFLISEELLFKLGAPELEYICVPDVAQFAANLAAQGINFRKPHHAYRIKSFLAMRAMHESGGHDAFGRQVTFAVNSRPAPTWTLSLAKLLENGTLAKALRAVVREDGGERTHY